MKLHLLLKITIALISLVSTSHVLAQNKVVVIPMFDTEIVFTGVGTTGNTRCSEYVEGDIGAWVEVSPCLAVDPSSIQGQDADIF